MSKVSVSDIIAIFLDSVGPASVHCKNHLFNYLVSRCSVTRSLHISRQNENTGKTVININIHQA